MEKAKNAHLYIFYPSVVRLLSCEDRAIVKVSQQFLARVGNELGMDPQLL